MPQFVYDQLVNYIEKIYGIGDTDKVVDRTYAHLYPSTSEAIACKLDKHKDGIKNEEKSNSSTDTY